MRARAWAGSVLVVLPCLASVPCEVFAATGAAPPAAASARDEAVTDPATVVRVFEVRYRDVGEVSLLIQPALAPAVLTVNRATRTVTVVDRPEVVRKVEEFLAQFDVPPHAVVVRIVIEKARLLPEPRRVESSADGGRLADSAAWEYVPLAETTFEVLERAEARHAFGEDGAFEIHVRLDSVDPIRRVIRFDDVALARFDRPAAGGAPARRDLFATALDLQDRVGKVVMAAQDPAAEEALVMRVVGLVREPPAGGR